MISLIPATIILKNPNAQAILTIIDDSLTLVPTVIQSIPVSNESKLSSYNKKSIYSDLTDSNLQEEIKKLQTIKEKSEDLSNLKKEYEKFSKDTFSHNRFQTINTDNIRGVGVDGSGFHPTKYYEENIAIKKIEEEASISSKWNPSPGDGEDILRESIKNVCFWQACNVGQLPIGSPVQVCSAVIELLSPIDNKITVNDTVNFIDEFTGREFIKNREEIKGLRYLIDGNMFEIENKNRLIKGVRSFDDQLFKRFGINGTDIKGKSPENDVNIYLITEANSTGAAGVASAGYVKFQYDPTGATSATVKTPRMINNDFRDEYLIKLITDNPPNDKKLQRGVVLFLFTIFFEYGCYIFNLYNEHLINKLPKELKETIDELKRANYSMLANFIKLINYSLIQKFKIKDKDGKFYNPDGFILIDQSEKISEPYKDKTITKVIKRIFCDRIMKASSANTIRIWFNSDAYKNWDADHTEFSLDNFPISFASNMGIERIATLAPGRETFLNVNYQMTITRLTNFLLQNNDGKIPLDSANNIIAVGAPFQNDEIFEQTFESLSAYFDFIKGSKQIYKQYAELKLGIFRSGYPTQDLVKNRDYFLSKYSLIYTTYTNPQTIDIEYLKVIHYIMNEYKKYRQRELKLLDDKTLFENNKRRILGNRMSDISTEEYRGILRVKFGLAAEMIIKVAELSYDIFLSRNPGATSNFKSVLQQKKTIYDAEVAIELQKIIDRQKIYLNKKFGKGSAQLGLIGINNPLPPPPPQFMAMMSSAFPQLGISVQSGPTMGQPMGQPGSIGRINISLEQRLKVEQLKFWQDLRTIFSGRTILLPIAKLKSNNIFDDDEFYLLDVFRSMIFNKLSTFQISENGRISQKLVDAKVLNNAYLMLCANTVDLGNPNSWRCINYNSIARMKKLDGTFKDIKKIRGIFFNLIANNSFLIEAMRVSIPAGSNTALGLVKYCNYAMKKELPKCNILISRQLFAQTIQPKMGTFSGTMGIDLLSGVAYFEMGPYTQSRNSDIVVR